jgi:hypothetical protein
VLSETSVVVSLEDDIPYRGGSELIERMEAAITRDRGPIDVAGPRLFWTDSAQDLRQLKASVLKGFKAATPSEPRGQMSVDNITYDVWPL